MASTTLLCVLMCCICVFAQRNYRPQQTETTTQGNNYEEVSTGEPQIYGNLTVQPQPSTSNSSDGYEPSSTPRLEYPSTPTQNYGNYSNDYSNNSSNMSDDDSGNWTASCGPCPPAELVRNCNGQQCQNDNDCPGKEFCCESTSCNGKKICRKFLRPAFENNSQQPRSYLEEENGQNRTQDVSMDQLKQYVQQYGQNKQKEFRDQYPNGLNATENADGSYGNDNHNSNNNNNSTNNNNY